MGDRYDYLALQWIKGEIGETLKKVRQSIEAYAENPEQLFPLYMCRDYVHQVHGILQIVKLHGCAILSEEMEQLIEAIIDGHVPVQRDAMEVLMAAAIQLPNYLDQVQENRVDQPLGLLPLLNDMRLARGERLLSETSLFTPDLSSLAGAAVGQEAVDDDLLFKLRKARQAAQVALTGFIRNQDTDLHLAHLVQVFQSLERLCRDLPVVALWSATLGFLEGAQTGAFSGSAPVRTVLRRVDQEFRRLLENPALLTQPASEEMLRSLLFYIAHTNVESPRIVALKQRYRLDDAVLDGNVALQAQASRSKPDGGALRSVADALGEELSRVKDGFDLFVRGGKSSPADLAGLLEPMKQIADTLAVLGFGDLRRSVLEQRSLMQRVSEGQEQVSDQQLMDAAGALLAVEAELQEVAPPEEDLLNESNRLPSANVQRVQQAVIKESRQELEHVKDAIVEFIVSQWDHQHLLPVPEKLNQIAGGLAMISLQRASDLLRACGGYVDSQVLAENAVPEWYALDSLADAISAVDYYLERMEEDPESQNDSVLDIADEMVVKLNGPGVGEAGQGIDGGSTEPAPRPSQASSDLGEKADKAEPGDAQAQVPPLAAEEVAAAKQPEASEPSAPVASPATTNSEAAFEAASEPPVSAAIGQGVDPDAASAAASLPPSEADLGDDNEEIREIFAEEAAEVFETLSSNLAAFQEGDRNSDAVTEIRRAFHTLKGSGRMVNATAVGELAWAVEELLNRVLDDSVALNEPVRLIVARVVQRLPALVEEFSNHQQRQHDDVDQLVAAAHALAEGRDASVPEEPAAAKVEAPSQGALSEEVASVADLSATLPQEDLSESEGVVASEEPSLLVAGLQAKRISLLPPEDEGSVGDDDEEIREIFAEEVGEVLESFTDYLPRWESDVQDHEALTEVRRAFHTLKGSGRMVNATVLGELAWAVENLLNRVLEGSIPADERVHAIVRQVVRLTPQLVEEFSARQQRQREDVDDLASAAHALADAQAPAETAAPAVSDERAEAYDPELLEIFRDETAVHLDALAKYLGEAAGNLPWPVDNALHRALHTLKGSAAMAGIQPVVDLVVPVEKLVVEYLDNRWALDQPEIDVLTEALELLRDGVHQLATRSSIVLPKAAELEERAAQLLSRRVADRQTGERTAGLANRLHELLQDGLNNLFAVEEQIQAWKAAPSHQPQLAAALSELQNLIDWARAAGLQPLVALGQALQAFYRAIEGRALEVSSELLGVAEEGQEALTGIIDDLAAGQVVQESPERLASIDALRRQVAGLSEGAATTAGGPEQAPVESTPVAAEDEEIKGLFLEEGEELLDDLEDAIGRWGGASESRDALEEILRLLHTFKGAARAAGLEELGNLAHDLESELAPGSETDESQEQLLEKAEVGYERLAGSLGRLRPAQGATQGAAVEVSAGQQPDGEPQAGSATGQLPDFLQAGRGAASLTQASPQEQEEDEILQLFLEEGEELLESLEAVIGRWSNAPATTEPLDEVLRLLHTLKGAARAAGVTRLGDLAHALESELDQVDRDSDETLEQALEQTEAGYERMTGLVQTLRESGKSILEPGALEEAVGASEAESSDVEETPVPADDRSGQVTTPATQTSDVEALKGEEDFGLGIFLEEADELLESLEAATARWSEDLSAVGPLDEILRILHTLKGGARMAGLVELGDLTHGIEQALAHDSRDGGAQQSLQAVQTGHDQLLGALQQARKAAATPAEPEPAIAAGPGVGLPRVAPAAAEGVAEDIPFGALPGEAEAEAEVEARPQRNTEQVKITTDLLEDIVNLAGETSIFRSRVEQQIGSLNLSLKEMDATIERTRDQLRRLDTETQAQVISRHQTENEQSSYQDFDPLEMDRYSQMQQLSRALFESASDLVDLKDTLEARIREAQSLLVQQGRVNTELQENLMRTRMVPFERSALRLRRIVRQTSKELGKQIDFVVDNAEGEIDRTILERMTAPLEHMLRNAIDHGIETEKDRIAAGKPPVGRIRLSLNREGGEVVIALSDDGRGISVDAVRRKAIEKGLLDPKLQLTEKQLLGFILESGFSTATQVTQISGRGVGLDVVNAEVRQLGGTIEVDSVAGQGSRFLVRLPFSTSVDRALMVNLGDDVYAVPLNTIEGVSRVMPRDLAAFYKGEEQKYRYGGTDYEVISLADLLGRGHPTQPDVQSVPLIFLGLGDRNVAVLVDELTGSQEIVVKSLGPQFGVVPGLSGATFLGDGRVVVILDLRAAIRAQPATAEHRARLRAAEPKKQRLLQVMVVDDSITMRKVTSRLLERNGMEAITAKDGVEAIGLLQDTKPDLMLLDIEMPRMDGFEVAAQVRHNDRLKDLPIIMITSRTGEKHRERALSLGVNDYLGKPYREDELLGHIRRLTAQSPQTEVVQR